MIGQLEPFSPLLALHYVAQQFSIHHLVHLFHKFHYPQTHLFLLHPKKHRRNHLQHLKLNILNFYALRADLPISVMVKQFKNFTDFRKEVLGETGLRVGLSRLGFNIPFLFWF